MIYHVTRDGGHTVVTVNADTAQEAARLSGWKGVELRVTRPVSGENPSDWMEQGETVMASDLELA